MKRVVLFLLCAALPPFAFAATPGRTATEAYVTNKVGAAAAATLQAAKDYADGAISAAGSVTPEIVTNIVRDIAPAPDFSTNNAELVQTVRDTSPAPDFSSGNAQLVATIEATAPAPDLSPAYAGIASVSQAVSEVSQSISEVRQSLAVAAQSATNYTDAALAPYCTIAAAAAMTNGVMNEVRGGFLPAELTVDGYNVTNNVDFTALAFFSSSAMFSGGIELTSGWESLRAFTSMDVGMESLPEYLDSREAALTNGLATAAALQTVSNTAAAASAYSTRIYQYMTANTNAWFEGTNYESTAGIPCTMQLYEIRDGEKKRVWDQREFTQYFHTNVVQAQMDELRSAISATSNAIPSTAWSKFASGTGEPMPTNAPMTWISTPTTVFSGGYEWQRVVGAEGDCWILVNNGMVAEYGSPEASTNGASLTITDLDGNEIMAVRKTSSYEAGAVANSCYYSGGVFVAKYAALSSSPPTSYITTDLRAAFVEEGQSDCPATVAWSGSSGDWTATITPAVPTTSLFVRAKFTVEGSTAVQYSAPVAMQQIVIGGTKYTIGTASISGHTVLTLTPAP